MKHTVRFLFSAAFICAGMIPAMSYAATFQPLDYTDIRGVTEAQFQHESTCGDGCDATLDRKIIMRVEDKGQMYWLNNADGLPRVNRYLPNGFYTADGKYYLVSEGIKIRLKKGEAYDKILSLAQNPMTLPLILPMNDDDLMKMSTTCEYYGEGDPETDPNFQECLREVEEGGVIADKYAGKVILRVDQGGSLAFIDGMDRTTADVIPLNGTMSPGSFFKYVKQEARTGHKAALDALVPYARL